MWQNVGKNISCASQVDVDQVRAAMSAEEWDHALYRAGFRHLVRPRRLPQDQDDDGGDDDSDSDGEDGNDNDDFSRS